MLEQKTDDLNRDERMKNFVLYRLPESGMDTAEKRKEDEAKKIKRAPVCHKCRRHAYKIFSHRQIRWEKNSAPTNESHHGNMWGTEQSDVQPKKISTAEQHLKDLSISYDMTNEERALVKDKVEEAKEKTKKNWVYKIRGPYWNLREIRVRKPVEEAKEGEA